jgi:hypothetical protein
MQRIALAIVVIALGLALAEPSRAGPRAPNACSDGQYSDALTDVSILTSPITLGLELGNPTGPYPGHVALCYSTSPKGYSGSDTTGGHLAVNVLAPWNGPAPANAVCVPEDNTPAGALLACRAELGRPVVGIHPDSNGGSGDTVSFVIPVMVCTAPCTSLSPGISDTGAFIGGVTWVPAPPGQVGGSYRIDYVELWINGAHYGSSSPVDAGVTVNPNGVQYGTGGGGAWVGTPGDTLATVIIPIVGQQGITVPTACLSVGTTCAFTS